MPHALRFLVGGLELAVTSPDAPLDDEHDPDYLPFLADVGGGEDGPAQRLDLEVRLGETRVPDETRPLIEAGESWRAFARGEGLVFSPQVAAAGAHPDWLAAIAPDRRSATLTCAESLLVGSGAARRLAAPFRYPLDQLLLSLALAGEGLILHAAGVAIGSAGLVLAGASRAGKTTIARLCAAAGHRVLSDDRVILRRGGSGWTLRGTPWPGEGKFVATEVLPPAAVVFLVQGDENRVRRLSPGALAGRLLPLASVPWYDRAAANRCLDCAAALAAGLPACELVFRPDAEAVRVLERFLGPPVHVPGT